MTNYILQITLQSPLTSGAGEGRVGLVDRDVAFDELGLPILPGRRLKGLWREAYRDVVDAWTFCGESPILADQIFGKVGQKPGGGDACLHIANAELQEASSLKPWLRYLHHPKIQKLHPDDVVQHFSTVRAQTAIDRRTGAALENTLRLTRTLQTGLVFRAPLRFVKPPDDALKNALALGAAALQYMGTARTRGLGKVCCRLLKCDASGRECDLTEQALTSDALPSITVATSSKQPSETSEGQTIPAPCSKRPFPTHLLRYRLTLTEPVVIPVADGDPNTVVTRQDVPGSHILGAAAWHYLSQPDHAPEDDGFRHAFLDGGLRFLTAYPEAHDPDESNEPPQRMIPIPHSIRKFKDSEDLVDFVEQSPGDDATKRFDHRYAKIEQRSLKTQAVKTERNYHHARACDRRKGRASENDGAFFRYEAIQADQKFQGAVLGSEGDLNTLQASWLHGVQSIRIGRSRSTQYGEVKFEWIDDTPQDLNGFVEWNGFVEPQDDDENALPCLDDCLIITTLSPLLTVNDRGHPEARFPERELAEVLDLDTSNLILSRSYTRTEVLGGYHTHLRLPRQQWPAIAAGSVFVFCLKKALDEERLLQLEHNGLGVRKGEGYGRIAVNRQKDLHLTGHEESRLDDPERQGHPNAPAEVPQNIQELLRGVVRMRCLAEMRQRAMDVARAEKNIPSNALLGRLRLFLQQNDPDESVESLKELRDPAKEGLANYRISTREADMTWLSGQTTLTLYDLFKKAWTEPKSLTEKLIKEQVEKITPDFDDDKRMTMVDGLVNDHSDALCREFLDHLLTALRRKD